MIKILNKTNIAILLSSYLLVGCGGENMETKNKTAPITTPTPISSISNSINSVSGLVIDGYISNATVCFDINNNDICEDNEPSSHTDKLGAYNLNIEDVSELDRNDANIISFGGIDTFSNTPFTNMLKSNYFEEENINLNSLTTLIADFSSNEDYEYNKNRLADIMKINSNDINSDIVRLKDKTIFKNSLKIQSILNVMNKVNFTDVDKIKLRTELSEKLFNQQLSIDELIESLDEDKYLTLKEETYSIMKLINKNVINQSNEQRNIRQSTGLQQPQNTSNKWNIFIKRMKNVQAAINKRLQIVRIDNKIEDILIYKDNVIFLNTLQNENVKRFLKKINFRFRKNNIWFPDYKLFLENLYNMNLTRQHPSITELNTEMDNVGLTNREKKIMVRLYNSNQ